MHNAQTARAQGRPPHIMFRLVFAILALLLAVGAFAAQAATERRVALVIGNANYQHAPRLVNPINDADKLAAKLEDLDFEVIKHHNLGYTALLDALDQFSRKAAGADWAMVYYAGHGIQVDGKNYLIPVDVKLLRQGHLRRTVALDDLLIETGQAGRLGLVILDACRDNPFAASLNQGTGRSIAGRGLARVEETGGDVLVAFATKADAIAADGEGDNSPYMQALLQHLDTPGLEIRQFFGKVRDGVMQLTANQQQPFTYGSIGGGAYYFRPPHLPPPPPYPGHPLGHLQVNVNAPAASVSINGIPQGQAAPGAPLNLRNLKAGVHSVAVSAPGYQMRTVNVEVQANQWAQPVIELEPLQAPEPPAPAKAMLTVRPTPADAQVRIMNIDPKYQDGIPLQPGDYRIEVSKTGYQTHDQWYDLAAGERTLAIRLEEQAQPQGRRIGHDWRYMDNGDGTVTDTVTKLQWMRCSLGQTWTGNGCTGEQKEMKWEEAKDQAAHYAGYSDWRTPSIEELRTLVYCSNGKPDYFSNGKNCDGTPGEDHLKPTLDPKAFPSQSISEYWFWSSSAHAYGSYYAWVVSFYYGSDNDYYRSGYNAVRLVRGGQ